MKVVRRAEEEREMYDEVWLTEKELLEPSSGCLHTTG